MNWLKKLFGSFDRTELASDRIADAMEGMAADIEAARKQLRERIGIGTVANLEYHAETPKNKRKAATPHG